jgi:hypothetical protein
MKKLIWGFMLALTTAAPMVYADDEVSSTLKSTPRACSCQEYERRSRGLNYVVNRVNVSQYERYNIENQLRNGNNYYRQAQYTNNVNDQERGCSMANQAVDSSWRRWQPWLAQRGIDYEVYCNNNNNDNDYNNFPINGDRQCERFAWLNRNRAERAIVLREGPRNAYKYQVVPTRRGCFTYRCRYGGYCQQD